MSFEIQDSTMSIENQGTMFAEGLYDDTDTDTAGVGRAGVSRDLFKAKDKGPNGTAKDEANTETEEAGDTSQAKHDSALPSFNSRRLKDRGTTFSEELYADIETYAHGPKAGAIATAGVGRAGVSNCHFEAKAKGPNAITKAEANIQGQGMLDIIDNFDRPGRASAEGPYAGTKKYAHGFENKPGKRVPKAGAKAEAGVGRAGASWSIFEAEAKGPNASAEAEAKGLEAGAMVRAEIGSASASAGPVNVKIGLGVDTGVKVSPTSVEVKVLGTGLSLGSTTGISLFGSEFKIKLW